MSSSDINANSTVRPLRGLFDCRVSATDGEIGTIDDFFFDDTAWIVRYFHIDTGPWLNNRQILISPVAIINDNWDHGDLSVALTKDTIAAGPAIPTWRDMSHQEEADLIGHFDWMPYWGPAKGAPVTGIGGVGRESDTPLSQPAFTKQNDSDIKPQLRRFGELINFEIRAKGVNGGGVVDAVVDIQTWIISKLAVSTRKWLPGGNVLVPLPRIDRVDWAQGQVHVDLTRKAIKNSPKFRPHGSC